MVTFTAAGTLNGITAGKNVKDLTDSFMYTTPSCKLSCEPETGRKVVQKSCQ